MDPRLGALEDATERDGLVVGGQLAVVVAVELDDFEALADAAQPCTQKEGNCM